jgi:hypothetical protein
MGLLSKLFRRKSSSLPPAPSRLDDALPEPDPAAPPATHDDELSRLAIDPLKREEFLSRILTDGVWLLATIRGAVSRPESKNDLIEYVKDQAERLSQDEFGTPYTYSLKGSIVLPIFSSEQAAREFVTRLRLTTTTAFQMFSVTGTFWAQNDFGLIRVMFNPFSNCSAELTDPELRKLQSIASTVE